MGITGLLPFVSAASRKAHVSEWSGCSVGIDAYCWLHKGAFACADRLARGDATDLHIKYCMKYVNMLLLRNIKPVLVFDGRHLPAKAATEAKRRESRTIAKKRAAELLKLGQVEEARTYMRRSVDISHEMALQLMRACRARRVDCIVAPYEADAQLAYLNIRNIVQLVITEDSDLILFGCTKVLFKMDLDGSGTLVEATRLPLVMKMPIERYTIDKFRRMCVLSGCDYISSLPGVGLSKARQFVAATQDPNFANALRKLPSFLNKPQLVVTDEYRVGFLKAEATFKHQYVFDPLTRSMVRLTDPDDEDTDIALCSEAGELLEPDTAFQLALGNLEPFTLRRMDDWHPDAPSNNDIKSQSQNWKDGEASKHPSIWDRDFVGHVREEFPWKKKAAKREDLMMRAVKTKPRKQAVIVVPETQDESLTLDNLKNMYCVESDDKRQKVDDTKSDLNALENEGQMPETSHGKTSPIIVNKNRCYKKVQSSYSVLKRLSKFPRTIMDDNLVESKFFSHNTTTEKVIQEDEVMEIDLTDSQKENSPIKLSPKKTSPANSPTKDSLIKTEDRTSPILELRGRNPFKISTDKTKPLEEISLSEDSVVENTYPMETLVTPVDSQSSFGSTLEQYKNSTRSLSQPTSSRQEKSSSLTRHASAGGCRVPGLSRSKASNQQTLLSKFGFQKKSILKP